MFGEFGNCVSIEGIQDCFTQGQERSRPIIRNDRDADYRDGSYCVEKTFSILWLSEEVKDKG